MMAPTPFSMPLDETKRGVVGVSVPGNTLRWCAEITFTMSLSTLKLVRQVK